MTRVENIEIFFIEYPFPKNLNYQYSGGLVENMIVGLIKITDSDGEYTNIRIFCKILFFEDSGS